MKRQRNTQQVKEHEKCPPSQTKEEEIGNLPEKEFRIMIIKMIQNLENKMELQINSLETKIEKMQEMFNKDLEEIKKSQYIMNNAINEIKNTLEGTKSRITETEDRISEVEDKMVEINEADRKKATYEIQDRKYVYIVNDSNKTVGTNIDIFEINNGQDFIVTKGLKPGDRIVIEGVGTSVKDGMTIKPIDKTTPIATTNSQNDSTVTKQ